MFLLNRKILPILEIQVHVRGIDKEGRLYLLSGLNNGD